MRNLIYIIMFTIFSCKQIDDNNTTNWRMVKTDLSPQEYNEIILSDSMIYIKFIWTDVGYKLNSSPLGYYNNDSMEVKLINFVGKDSLRINSSTFNSTYVKIDNSEVDNDQNFHFRARKYIAMNYFPSDSCVDKELFHYISSYFLPEDYPDDFDEEIKIEPLGNK